MSPTESLLNRSASRHPPPASTIPRQGHHDVRIEVIGLEDGGVLGVDQLGGDRRGVFERLQRVGEVAGVEGDLDGLAAVNAVDGVTVFTVPDGLHVDAGRTLAGVKVTPLAIAETSVQEAERAALGVPNGARILSVRPFLPLRVAAIVRQQLTDDARARFERSLGMRSAWFGGTTMPVRYVADDPEQIRRALLDAAATADIVLAVGVASVDPLEVTWQSLLAAGATSVRRGLPMHPGSSYWIAELLGRPVIGVASCGMFSRRSALDLLIARLHAGLPLDARYLASLGHGGLLGKEAAWRIPPYEAALDDDPDDV